jgi:cell filamentation protein
MVVHSELAERSGISINWAATDKGGYLTALTRELERPGKGHLDAYLAPHVGGALGKGRLIGHLSGMQSLAGNPAPSVEATDMAGSFSDPAVQARYQHQLERRQQPENAVDDSSRTHSPDSGRSDGRRGRGRGGR